MKRIVVLLAIIPVVTSGCITPKMWNEGFETTTTADDAYKMPGYQPPTAVKDTNGDVVLDYDAVKSRTGLFGGVPSEKSRKLVRVQERASISQLRPMTNWNAFYPGIRSAVKTPPATNDDAFVSVGGKIPVSEQRDLLDRDFEFPASERILSGDERWGWYVPPREAGKPALIATLPKNTSQMPMAILPVKVVLTPVTLTVDAARCMTFFIVLPFELSQLDDLH